MELLILINCHLINKCRVCHHFLKWIIHILGYKWDNIRFIKLKEALKLAKYLKTSFSHYTLVDHFADNHKLLKEMIKRVKIKRVMFTKGKKTAFDVIAENKSFFVQCIDKYIHDREFIFNILSNNNNIYGVDDFKK